MSRRFYRLSRERQSKEIQVLTGGGVVASGASVGEWFNVVDYGADRTGATDSAAEIQDAIDAAEAVNGVVYFPRGTYRADKGAGTGVLTVNNAVTLMGEGKGLSKIDFYPKTAVASYYGIDAISATEGPIVIKGMELIGPDTVAAFETRGIQTSDYDMHIIDVNLSGVWTNAIQTKNSNSLTNVVDCVIEAEKQCISSSTSASFTENRLHITDTHFVQITSTSSGNHIMYINPGMNLWMERCRFSTTPSGAGYAVYLHGTDATVADYVVIQDCVFESGLLGLGGIWTNENTVTKISSCDFVNSSSTAIIVQDNGALVSNCYFNAAGITTSTDQDLQITNCYFTSTAETMVSINGTMNANISNCRFIDSRLEINGAATGRVMVSNCEFEGSTIAHGIRNYDALLTVVNTNFYGTYGTAALYNSDTTASTGYAYLRGCNFYAAGGTSIRYSGLTKSLFASDCYFAGQAYNHSGSAVHSITFRGGIGGDIASSGNITLDGNFDTYHVTGTTTIDNIYVHNSNLSARSMYHGAVVKLIADDNWALSSSGNIVAHAITRQVNDVVELVFDAEDDKWYEQHSPTSGTVFTQTASVTVSNTVTETTLVSTGVGSATLPANFFKVGRTIRLKMRGYNSTAASAGTITMRAKLGSTVICATPANTATNNLSNRGWGVEVDITCRTTGASGTVFGQGKSFRSTGAGASNHWMMTATGTSTIDTTATQAVSITVQWGTANAGNTITATNFTLEVLN